MNIVMNIKQLRKAKGWTQTQLAENIGTIQKVVANYEAGTTKPPLERIIALAQTFEVSSDELIGLKEIKTDAIQKEKAEHGNSRSAKMNKIFKSLSDNDQKSVLHIVKKMV